MSLTRLRGIRLGNFSFCNDQLQLGNLSGNEFRILMRRLEVSKPAQLSSEEAPMGVSSEASAADFKEQVAEACKQLRDSGFINYFGLQRFGTGGTPTHKVGSLAEAGFPTGS